MKRTRTLGSLLAVSMMMAVVFLYSNYAARGSDHQDSPATIAHPGADITDPYIFPATNPNNVVLVMNVHPLIPSGQGLSTYFDPGVLYQMKFDTKSENGGGLAQAPVENLVIQFQAGAPGANQPIYVNGPAAPSVTGATGNAKVGFTGQGTINVPFTVGNGQIQVFAGAREDSFFFDLAQFLKILPDRNAGNTTTPLQPGGLPSCLPQKLGGNNSCPQGFNPPGVASDTLKGFNVLSLVIEMPRSMLMVNGGGPKVAFWTTTSTASGQ